MGVEEAFPIGLRMVFEWPTLPILLLGVLVGLALGVTPGMGSSLALVLWIPLAINFEPHTAIILMVSVYAAGMYGNCVASILLNTPGSASSAATALDGYPMSQQGRGYEALIISAIVSSFGGLGMVAIAIAILPVLIPIMLLFQSPEQALIALLGVSMIAVATQGSFVKGLLMGFLGFSLTTIGVARNTLVERFTFGSSILYDGISFIPVLIGLFAVAEMIKLSSRTSIQQEVNELQGQMSDGFNTVWKYKVHTVKTTLIGGLAGMIPGSGGVLGSFMAYAEGVRAYGHEGNFGEGDPRGVISSEAADNAAAVGALIPTFAFGIPGSGSTAILLGVLVVHGINPGPSMFSGELLNVTMSVFIAMGVANVIILLVGLSWARRLSFVTKIDTHIFIPAIIVLCTVAAFAIRINPFDMIIVVVFGFVGYTMTKHNYSIVSFVLGIVLGEMVERNVLRSFALSDGSPMIFVGSPAAIVLTSLIVIILAYPLVKHVTGSMNRSET